VACRPPPSVEMRQRIATPAVGRPATGRHQDRRRGSAGSRPCGGALLSPRCRSARRRGSRPRHALASDVGAPVLHPQSLYPGGESWLCQHPADAERGRLHDGRPGSSAGATSIATAWSPPAPACGRESHALRQRARDRAALAAEGAVPPEVWLGGPPRAPGDTRVAGSACSLSSCCANLKQPVAPVLTHVSGSILAASSGRPSRSSAALARKRLARVGQRKMSKSTL
jgi:hypothetical protein